MQDSAPPPFVFHPGTQPLVLSIPHMGTYVPPAIAARFTDDARRVPDTDWHLSTASMPSRASWARRCCRPRIRAMSLT